MAAKGAIAAAVQAIRTTYENEVFALRSMCRKVCAVADIVDEVAFKAKTEEPRLHAALEIMVETLAALEQVVVACSSSPVRAKLFSHSLVSRLRLGAERIMETMATLEGLVGRAELDEALDEMEDIVKAFASFRDAAGDELRRFVVEGNVSVLVARLHQVGLAEDEADARGQLLALQSEAKLILEPDEGDAKDAASSGWAGLRHSQTDKEMLAILVRLDIPSPCCSVQRREAPARSRRHSRRKSRDVVDAEGKGVPDAKPLVADGGAGKKRSEAEIPDHFRCPITLEIMEDPVFLFTQSGRSFERAALEQWLAYHPAVDPLTNEVHATLLEFAPNRVLRDVIATWCREHGLPEPQRPAAEVSSPSTRDGENDSARHARETRVARSPSLLNEELDRMTQQFPQTGAIIHRLSADFSDTEREAAARALVRECDEAENEEATTLEIRHAGGISSLVVMLSSIGTSYTMQEAAALALWKVSRRPRENRVAIANARAITPLVRLLSGTESTILAKQAAAGVLQNLSCYSASYKVAIANAGAIPPLVRLISLDPTSAREIDGVREDAARCLWSIAVNEQKKIAIANAGAIAPLVRLVAEGGNDGVREAGAGALQNLAANNSDNKAAIVAAGAIEPLVRLVAEGVSDGAKEAASGALQNLAKYNDENKTAIVRAGAIQPLAMLIADPLRSDKAKRTAARALENLAWNNDANKLLIAGSAAVPALVHLLQRGDAAADSKEAAAEALKVLTRSRVARSKVAKALGWRFLLTPSEADVDELITSYVRNSRRGVHA